MPQVTETNEQLYQKYIDTKDNSILDKITVQNKYYIRSLASKVHKANFVAATNGCIIEQDDLEQEGYIGFRKGLERYEISSGNKVITYCKSWALKYMREYYIQFEKTIRFPDRIRRDAMSGNIEDAATHKAMSIEAFSKPYFNISQIENVAEKESKINVEYEYLRLITSEFSDKELIVLNSLWEDGVKSFKSNVYARQLMSKIGSIYKTITSQITFASELKRNGKCELTIEEYNFWQEGYVGDKIYRYKAKDVLAIEKERFDFEIYKQKDKIIFKI